MRKALIARLSLLLVILALSIMATPSFAFPYCPYTPCSYYASLCEEYGGVPSRSTYPGWCQDESYALRGYGMAYCTSYGSTSEMGECADW
jgi:hypothetical protein